MKPRLWTLSYDIANPRRLRRVAKLAVQYGERVQKSLYVCALSYDQFGLLHQHLSSIVHDEEDRLFLRPVCRACREKTRYQGSGGHPEKREPFWIV